MRLLLLAGTGEARAIAAGLAEAGVEAVASLAGAVRAPRSLALPTRIGGFGGEAGFRRFLSEECIGAVLDATHPFAARISARTARFAPGWGRPAQSCGRNGRWSWPGSACATRPGRWRRSPRGRRCSWRRGGRRRRGSRAWPGGG
ncbi:MAG: precorrin-6A/cobalt-precorrin-6A reductase [Paracoccaceae bacterium]